MISYIFVILNQTTAALRTQSRSHELLHIHLESQHYDFWVIPLSITLFHILTTY